jgi:glycoprotein-N-acetylgalactosamine 3-beta-galactosyltransferase
MEDVMIAQCLRDVFQIGLTDTRDDQLRERFHPFAPASHYYWRPPEEGNTDWYKDYNEEWPPLLGEKCCAPDSVSFHYIKKPAMVRHLYALLNTCGKTAAIDNAGGGGGDTN